MPTQGHAGPVSQFTNALILTLLEGPDGKPIMRGDRVQWLLSRQIIYDVGAEFSGESIRVPAEFVTDLASIPAPFSAWLPPDGPWVKAAVIHDFLFATSGTCVFNGYRYCDRLTPYTWEEANAILAEAMKVLGVPASKRAAINAGVSTFSRRAWGT